MLFTKSQKRLREQHELAPPRHLRGRARNTACDRPIRFVLKRIGAVVLRPTDRLNTDFLLQKATVALLCSALRGIAAAAWGFVA